jgi:hypothetical protein
MKCDKTILVIGIIILAGLAVKSLKQFIYLSFTLLSLKIVWVGLVIFIILRFLKKANATIPGSKK